MFVDNSKIRSASAGSPLCVRGGERDPGRRRAL